MQSRQHVPKDIDEYIAGFPDNVQEVLQKVRATIRAAAPNADEAISYRMPTFKLNGKYLVYFAGYTNHIGVYPLPAGDKVFAKDLRPYKSGKGTARFPLDKPIPYELIGRIVTFRAREDAARAEAKRKPQ